MKTERLSKGITGIAGEYLVSGELSLRGFMASVTLRNNESVDIHASNLSSRKTRNKIIAIQVKASQNGNRRWPLKKKAELTKSPNHYYVFVSFKGLLTRPEYFIVRSRIVASTLKKGHSKWLITPGKRGQPNRDNEMRVFADGSGEYLERWDLLTRFIALGYPTLTN